MYHCLLMVMTAFIFLLRMNARRFSVEAILPFSTRCCDRRTARAVCCWSRRDHIRCSSSSSSSSSSWDDFMGKVDDLSSADENNRPYNQTAAATGEKKTGRPCFTTLDRGDHSKEAKEWPKPSPVEEIAIEGRRVFIKRDDLLHLPGSRISGNKARKMLSVNQIAPEKFPPCVISYGGPQSNSMLALAAIVNYKNRELLESADTKEEATASSPDSEKEKSKPIRFIYYTKKLPKFLRKQASGNLFRALALGMEITELPHSECQILFGGDWGGNPEIPAELSSLGYGQHECLWVPQGGASEIAQEGVGRLAEEISAFWAEKGDKKALSVVLPGGTCATALLLHRALSDLDSSEDNDIEVVVIPCVGSAVYARRQMMALSSSIGAAADDVPSILAPHPDTETLGSGGNRNDYFAFGEPDSEILETFDMMKEEYGLLLDLIYGAPAWAVLLRHFGVGLSADLTFDPRNPIAGRDIMYIVQVNSWRDRSVLAPWKGSDRKSCPEW